MSALRTLAALVLGVAAISMVVELVELSLVALVAGEIVTDSVRYFDIRNGRFFLAAKLVYTALAAVLGGFLAALIAGRRPLLHGGLLAVAQTVALGWALATPEIRSTGPLWMWIALVPLTALGVLVGAAWWDVRTRRS